MNDAFVQALADCAEENLVDLTTLRAQCLAKITGGGGEISFITAAGLNGKSSAQECKMDAAELLAAVNAAIRINSGAGVSLTYADFSQLR